MGNQPFMRDHLTGVLFAQPTITFRHARMLFNILLLSFLFPQSGQVSQEKKLLILGIDGCRPDALLKCPVPNLRALAENGTAAWYALSRPPTKSGPCWSSIFTGVWYDKHGVTDNTFINQQFSRYPMLFRRLKDADPGFYSGWFVYWPNLGTDMPHGADVSSGDWSDSQTQEAAVNLLQNGDPDALFVHFGIIDAVGHASGFDPDGPEYLTAIEETDGRVGAVLSALKARPCFTDEHWMIIALSDHGGLGSHHGGSSIEEMRTFFIIAGDGVPKGEIKHDWIRKTRNVPPYGIQLDGKDDCIGIPDGSHLHFGSGQDFTVEFCVKASGWSGQPVVIGNKDMNDGKNPGFAFALIDEGRWKVNIADGKTEADISGPVIDDGAWHHVAAVFHRGGTSTLFQDGIRTGAVDIAKLGSIDTPYGIVIGADGAHRNSTFAPASVSEVRIWKTALPDSAIWTWTFTPVTPAHSEYSRLIGYWKMNNGSGNLVSDCSAYANHGILAGDSPVWVLPSGQVETFLFDSCRTAKSVDLAVTALAHFGLEIRPEWGLDGKNLVPGHDPDSIGNSRFFPESPVLLNNYPNPFNGQTVICFSTPAQGHATLKIYDTLGQEVACVLDKALPAGDHRLVFSGEHLASGVYLLKLSTSLVEFNKKVLLIK
jgi:hypothetical protein